MERITAREAKAKATTQTPTESAEDRNRRMAIAAARRERAESAAYHLAAQGPDGEYLPDGGTWPAIGLSRLASAGLSIAVKSYRGARITGDTWQDIHGAIVVSALAKAAEAIPACEAEGCEALATWATPGPGPDTFTCHPHRPSLYRTVALPATERCGEAYTESVVTEDGDGNVTTTERIVTPRVKAPAREARIRRGRNLPRPADGPPVAKVNLAWSIERAKGLLADHWAAEAIPVAWNAEAHGEWVQAAEAKVTAEAEARAAERWASALTWQALAPHLGAEAPAERMALALALTDGMDRAEAGNVATTFGAKAPMSAEAAKKAVQRATKALAERLTVEAIRAAILTALGETEAAEAEAPAESVAVLAPVTMANRRVPTTEARLGLAAILNRAALRSAFLARHIWPAKAAKATPGQGHDRVALAPVILAPTFGGREALALQPVRVTGGQDGPRVEALRHLATEDRKAEAKATAKAEARMADPLAWAEAWHARAEYLAREAEAARTRYTIGSTLASAANEKALKARNEALRATTCKVTERPRTEAPRWSDEQAAEYLAHLAPGRPLKATPRPWPAEDTERHARTAEARAQAPTWQAPTCKPTTAQADPLPTRNLPAPWRIARAEHDRDTEHAQAAEALHVRPLTPAEQAEQKTQKTQAAKARKAWPLAEQKAWQAKADAAILRRERAAKRAARKAAA